MNVSNRKSGGLAVYGITETKGSELTGHSQPTTAYLDTSRVLELLQSFTSDIVSPAAPYKMSYLATNPELNETRTITAADIQEPLMLKLLAPETLRMIIYFITPSKQMRFIITIDKFLLCQA